MTRPLDITEPGTEPVVVTRAVRVRVEDGSADQDGGLARRGRDVAVAGSPRLPGRALRALRTP